MIILARDTTTELRLLVTAPAENNPAKSIPVHFRVTDGKSSIPADFNGVLPALFREGQGVVATGAIDASGTFIANEVLAKHDEKYMPPEVVDALKRSGRWQEGNQ